MTQTIAAQRRRPIARTILTALALGTSAWAIPPHTAHADADVSKAAKDIVVVDAKTEEVLKGALKYLAGQQKPNGSWSVNGTHPVAMTSYTLMAFLSMGNLPNEGEYGRTVANGVNFVLSTQRDDGVLIVESQAGGQNSTMYEHGIGTIMLGEMYGTTNDPKIRAKLEKCVKLILSAQSQQGGWRYHPRPEDADISVTVLQLVALRAAKNAGLDVPQETINRAVKYVKRCAHPSGGFTYQGGGDPGFARTAAAIYSLQVCGLYDDKLVAGGSKYLFTNFGDRHFFTYGSYYAAPAQYMIGGETWSNWYKLYTQLLLEKAKDYGDGAKYWQPIDGGEGQGDVYATAVYTTILAMPLHYIPLYQR